MGCLRRTSEDGVFVLDWYDAMGVRHRDRVAGEKKAKAMLRQADEHTAREREQRKFREGLGIDPGPSQALTLEALVGEYQAHILAERRPRTWQSIALGLKSVLGWFLKRGKPVEFPRDVQLAEVNAYVADRLAAGAACRTIAIRGGAVKGLFNWAVREGKLLVNPLARWKAPKGEPKIRRCALSAFQIAKLLRHSPPELADLWEFVLCTGVRSGELTTLTWSDLQLADEDREEAERSERQRQGLPVSARPMPTPRNLKDESRRPGSTIHIRAEIAKSRRGRFIALRKEAVVILCRAERDLPARAERAAARLRTAEERLAKASEAERPLAEKQVAQARGAVGASQRLVFVNSEGGAWRDGMARKMKKCLKAAGLPNTIDVHTLRHTFGSHLVAAGFDVRTVADVLGHSSPVVTMQVYAHSFADRTREAVEAVPLPSVERRAADGHETGTATVQAVG